jgi:hypothetical protein
MSNEVNGVETVPASTRKASKRSSTAVKLVQAAALAAVLVPLGTVSVETTTCGFGGYYNQNPGSGCGGSSPTHELFSFSGAGNNYTFDLTLKNPVGDFFVTIDDNVMNQASFAPRLAESFADYECVPIVDPTQTRDASNLCRDFVVDVGGGHFDHYDFTIDWIYDSEHNGFADMGGRVNVVHNRGSGINHNTFDQDMCITFGCTYHPDPDIGSGDTDFDSVAVAFDRDHIAAVPEPTTLVLLGSGVGGILYRRRRRKP